MFAGLVSMNPAAATTPDPTFYGAEALFILAHSVPAGREAATVDSGRLCEQVRRIAAESAPIPVKCADYGDVARAGPGIVSLLVHAAVADAPGAKDQLLVFSMRAERSRPLGSPGTFFGAAPRVAPLARAGEKESPFERALRASLSEILPWLRPAESTRLPKAKS
jgi:hypothetical protein